MQELARIENLAAEARLYSTGAAMNLLQLGRVLNEAKPLVGHGAWTDWVAENAHMPLRTAQVYMQAWRKFGENGAAAGLGTTAIIKLLPMSDEERARLLETYDVPRLTARGLDQAIREVRGEKDGGTTLPSRPAAATPPLSGEALGSGDEELKEARASAEHFAELARRTAGEKAAAEKELRLMREDAAEREDLMRAQAEELQRTQEELLALKSRQARGEASRGPSGEALTADTLAAAVQEFMGRAARMPYMATAFAGMSGAERERYAELLRTVEGWIQGARSALSAVVVGTVSGDA